MADITPGWKKLVYKLLAELGLTTADFARKEIAKKAEELRTPEETADMLLEKSEPSKIRKISAEKV